MRGKKPETLNLKLEVVISFKLLLNFSANEFIIDLGHLKIFLFSMIIITISRTYSSFQDKVSNRKNSIKIQVSLVISYKHVFYQNRG